MEFPRTPATRVTEEIMQAIRPHLRVEPAPQESHHYNRTFEAVYAILDKVLQPAHRN